VSANLVATGGRLDFYFTGLGSGTSWRFAAAQIELGDVMTPYQRVTSNFDITETGVESVSYAAFDLVDDALTTGAIAGGLTGQAFVAGDGGCYVSDLAVAAGGTFSIGGTSHNWTGAAPGILRAVTGDTGRVLDAMIREGTFTEDEIARLERYYRALGGKGLLVPGPELIVNGGFDTDTNWNKQGGWTISGGQAHVDSSVGGSTYLRQGTSIPDATYEITLDVTSFTSGILRVAAGIQTGLLQVAGTGTYTGYVTAKEAGGVGIYAYASSTVASIDNISVRRLIPREEL